MGGGFERQPRKTSLAHEACSTASPASTTPGKRTLTEQLPPRHDPHPVERLVHGPDAGAAAQRRVDPDYGDIVGAATAPVQRSAGTSIEHDDGAVPQLAAQGVAGGGGPLPHGDTIQQAFGHHDVSGIEAHVGGAAETASRGIGAEAYATGTHVAFAGAPSLHTAAHEAAHVVQQRRGVQLKGGVGQAGDPYEQHADQVADRVVAGQSAESLLDQVAGGGAATAVVQRRAEPGALVSATEYLKLNDRAAGDAIMRYLLAIPPPQPHPRLAWHNLGAFHQRLFKQLDRILYVFDNPADLAQLVHPQDPYAMIDTVRPIAGKQHGGAVGPWDWQPSVGTALAELIAEALVASLYRIGPRWLHIAELAGDVSGTSVVVDPDAIPRSHPMDRAVVPALCQQGVLGVRADKQHKAKPKSSTEPRAQPAGVGLRPVQYVWLGKESRDLWNWVRATSPADATVEEVSAQLFGDTAESHGEKHGDYLAFAMTSAPPLFGLPGHWAIKFDEGKAYAPATVPASSDDSANNLVTLAGSSLADEQALREANVAPDAKGAKPAAGTGAATGTLAEDALSQATYLKQTLAAWHLDKAVDPTLTFLGRRMGELADASKLTKWQPVLAGQKDKLSRVGAGVVELDRAVATMGLANKQGDDAKPLRDILRLYADAAGTSHLMQTSEGLLQRAATLQATLPLRGVQSATRDLGASADLLRDSTPQGDHERDQLSGAAVRIDEDSRKLQSRMMRGDTVDPNEVDRVTVNAGEIALKSKVHAIAMQVEALEKAAHDAGDGFFAAIASLFSSDFRGLEFETQVMKDSLESVTRDMDWQAQAASLGMRVENAKDLDDYNREMMRVRKEARARAQGQFATMATNDRIKNFLSKGATLVKWQSFRTSCVKLAVLIGVSIVGGALGGVVARGVGGMLMSSGGVAAMEDLSMGAQMIARGSSVVTETAVTSVGQTAIFGDKLSDSFLENMLMSVGSAGILKAIGHQAETLAQVERASAGLWAKAGAAGKLVLKEGAAITGHTIMGAALGYVSHRIVTGKTQPPPETLEEWLLQGASIAVGRYVGKAMEARAANAKRLAAIKGFAAGQKLLAATTALHEHALRAEANPQTKEAAELLAKRHEVLADEITALDELETSPELMKASGLHLSEVKQMRAEVQGQLAEVHSRAFAETSLHLAGLEELIPGALWTGTEAQVLEAIRTAHESGVSIKAKEDPKGGTWHVEIEGSKVEIEVRSDGRPGKPATTARAKNAADQAGLTGTSVEAPFRLAGLRAVVDGEIFEGTPKQIADALAAADRSGMPPGRTRDPQTGVWRITSGGRTYEIHEIGASPPQGAKRTTRIGPHDRVDHEPMSSGEPIEAEPLTREQRSELVRTKDLNPRRDGKRLAAKTSDDTLALGKKLASESEGQAILSRLAAGDASALTDIGVKDLPDGYNPALREFALLETRDGYIIVTGGRRRVDIPHGTRLLGHTHPESLEIEGHERMLDLRHEAGPHEADVTFAEIARDQRTAGANESGLIPSPADVDAVGDGGYQVLHTRYIHKGGGKIANPSSGANGPRVSVAISQVKTIMSNPTQQTTTYEATFTVRAGGETLWTGKIYAQRVEFGEGRFDQLWFDPPNSVKRHLEAKTP